MYTIIDKFSDTTLFASDENGNCILKVYLPEEKPVYDKLMTVRDANIANITGYTEIEGIPYVVSEFISGISIGEYVHDNGCMPDEMIRHIAQGICNGLSVVHSSGIVHRDITPE
ncbi:MAG: protein kinase, partial [Clostridia bacterium]|nr:protein kinase [Clostridia bacterium]